jgi:hypothetical protein
MDTSCKFPWTVNFVRLNDDSWKFCCKVRYSSYEQSKVLVDSVKTAFLNNQQHSACNSCWQEEAKGGVSFRTAEPSAATTVDVLQSNPPLTIIDIEFGDVCNMYCVTCGPYNSSTWQQIVKSPQASIESKLDRTWEKLKEVIISNPSIEHINMHGGEASMDPNFARIIDNLIEIGFKKKIRIITNGNYSESLKVKFERTIDRLIDNGNRVELIFSLDTAGTDGEWLRGGLSMTKFIPNILYMTAKNIAVSVNVSISILNLENHIEVLHLLESIGILDKVNIKINTINQPSYYSIASLGDKIHDFLPKNWPTEMSAPWLKHYKNLYAILAPQLNTEHSHSAKSIMLLLNRIKYFEKTASSPVTGYYQDLLARLEKLSVD